MKVCFKCGVEKSISSFYVHKKMADGRLNKCIDCTKKDTKKRSDIVTSTPEGLEAERKRQREKYRRLNYKEKQKYWDRDKPWKNSSKYKSLRKNKYKTLDPSFELHHWSYNESHLEDIIILDRFEHRRSHRLIKLDIESRLYRTLNGTVLDTKEAHLAYLIDNGINYTFLNY